MEVKGIEQSKIYQVAKNYEKEGYNVILFPRNIDIPEFIENYQPDIIASNEKETVVIEVKNHSDFSTIEKLRDVADAINKKENWRFELIVTGSKRKSLNKADTSKIDLNLSEIFENIQQVKILLEKSYYSSAFVMCWANLESLSRNILLENKKSLKNTTPLTLIKTLFSFGYLDRKDYENLERYFTIRNQIVHGYKVKKLGKKSVEGLVKITENLLKEIDVE